MSHDLEEIQREEAESKYRDDMEAFGLMVERACHRKTTKQWVEALGVVESLRPDAERGRKQKATCKENAAKGGKANPNTKYTNAEVEQAFFKFKKDFPKSTAWTAATALIRKGAALAAYRTNTGPLNRAGRIAKNRDGVTLEQWFSAL